MLKLKIGTTIISYSIRRSHRAKYVSLSIGADGVQIVAPFPIDDSVIISLVEKKQKWILNRFESYRQRLRKIPAERDFVSGEKLLFMGNNYPLKVLEHKGGWTNVNLTDGQFLVDINADIPIEKRREEIQGKLEQWYIRSAKELIAERLELFSKKIGVKVNAVRFKNQKTRWGSCSQKGNLNFNWKLVMAPTFIVDYVVVHELCHLKQMNHSPEFWQLVGNQISDYKKMRKWLKENGRKFNL
jgi:predicted metal-dependent hydrolase